MRKRNIKKWTAEDLNKELHVKTLGPVEHFLAKEGYSAEDLMRPIGDEQPNQVITESVKHAEIRMRHAIKRRAGRPTGFSPWDESEPKFVDIKPLLS